MIRRSQSCKGRSGTEGSKWREQQATNVLGREEVCLVWGIEVMVLQESGK